MSTSQKSAESETCHKCQSSESVTEVPLCGSCRSSLENDGSESSSTKSPTSPQKLTYLMKLIEEKQKLFENQWKEKELQLAEKHKKQNEMMEFNIKLLKNSTFDEAEEIKISEKKEEEIKSSEKVTSWLDGTEVVPDEVISKPQRESQSLLRTSLQSFDDEQFRWDRFYKTASGKPQQESRAAFRRTISTIDSDAQWNDYMNHYEGSSGREFKGTKKKGPLFYRFFQNHLN